MLIVFGGLPGTGKTTIARRIASQRMATYLRIDGIEQAMRDAGIPAEGIGAAGYAVANAIAEANFLDGKTVVANCVNPVPESREAWLGRRGRKPDPCRGRCRTVRCGSWRAARRRIPRPEDAPDFRRIPPAGWYAPARKH